MRIRRGALVIIMFVIALCAVSIAVPNTSKSVAAQPEVITWKSSAIHATPWPKLSVAPKKLSQFQLVSYQAKLKPTSPPVTSSTSVPAAPAPAPVSPTPAITVSTSLPTTTTTVTAPSGAPLSGGMWACIERAESGDRANDPTAPSGEYGILLSTWESLGYSGWPYEASITTQNQAAMTLYDRMGWRPWNDYCTGT